MLLQQGEVKQVSSGHLYLGPAHTKMLKGIEPGHVVHITIVAEVREVGKDRPAADSTQAIGDIGFDVKEVKIEKRNAFQEMAAEED